MARGPDRAVSLRNVLEVMIREPDPAFFTAELSDELNTTTQTVRNRVDELEELGYVEVKRDGRSMLFWITEAGYQHYVDTQ